MKEPPHTSREAREALEEAAELIKTRHYALAMVILIDASKDDDDLLAIYPAISRLMRLVVSRPLAEYRNTRAIIKRARELGHRMAILSGKSPEGKTPAARDGRRQTNPMHGRSEKDAPVIQRRGSRSPSFGGNKPVARRRTASLGFQVQPPGEDEKDLTPHLRLTPVSIETGGLVLADVYLDANGFLPGEFGSPVKAANGTQVDVQLVATAHFEVVGSGTRSFVFDNTLPRIVLEQFRLKPRSVPVDPPTSPALQALFTVRGRPCGKVARLVMPDGTPVGTIPETADSFRIDQPVPDQASITVTIMSNPINDGRQYQCTVTSPFLPDARSCDWNLRDTTEKIVTGYMDRFTSETANAQLLAELRGAGLNLFNSSPKAFKDAFWQLSDQGVALDTIAVVSEEPYMPWELMVPWRTTADGPDERENPIGVDFAVGRWILEIQSPSRSIDLSDSKVIAPSYDGGPNALASSDDEAKIVTAQFKGVTVRPADFDAVATALCSGSSLFHFVCHGNDQTTSGQSLFLDHEETLTSNQVRGIKGIVKAFQNKAPVVFLNACEVGRGSPALVGVGGFASQFITLGARAVIAPLWSVDDAIAHEIAVDFYDTLKREPKTPLAKILSNIRAKALTSQGKDTYAAYCFFGDPLATLT